MSNMPRLPAFPLHRASCAALVLAAFAATPDASANDTTAEMGTGGLVLARSDAVSMVKEVLSISMERITVDYVFKNVTDRNVETIVAFPMPDIRFSPDGMIAIPKTEADNFLGFTVTVDGAAVEPQLEQRAFASGIDITQTLKERGIPLQPMNEAGAAVLDGLDDAAREELAAIGAILLMESDVGEGPQTIAEPLWTLRSTYHWRMTFPAGKEIAVAHSYAPSVGATSGITFAGPYVDNAWRDDYRRRYCMDDAFIAAAEKRIPAENAPEPVQFHYESRIQYVLRTGANWAGPIADFTLRVDKGSPDNLVSFCAQGVTKTGPTTFEVKAKDFWPESDLDILFIVKAAQ
jgi:hypothetical protein